MGKLKRALLALVIGLLGGGYVWQATAADAALDYLHWPSADAKYATINGKHIWQNVKEQADIAERYRDDGHPQFWGRVAGTSGDVADTLSVGGSPSTRSTSGRRSWSNRARVSARRVSR